MNTRRRFLLLGLALTVFLAISYVENMIFFSLLSSVLQNSFLAVAMLFAHNVLVVSLILLAMTFYVDLVVLGFFRKEKYANIVIDHPRTFASVFAVVIVFLSILRGSSLLGGVIVENLHLILFISAPIAIVEGYGIYLVIAKTLGRAISMKDLLYIYGIFLVAAVMEVGFINVLKHFATA